MTIFIDGGFLLHPHYSIGWPVPKGIVLQKSVTATSRKIPQSQRRLTRCTAYIACNARNVAAKRKLQCNNCIYNLGIGL